MQGKFYNPYAFVPAVDPAVAGTYEVNAANPPDKYLLGHGRPAGHDRYQYEGEGKTELWSGRIGITIKTVTPLLIPDAAPETLASKDGHKVFRTRRDPRFGDNMPLLPVTAFKGPLRAAYEAITNSRFGVFRGHDAPLARRMDAKESLQLIPGRIVKTKSGDGLEVELLMGTTSGFPEWDATRSLWKIPDSVTRRNGRESRESQPTYAAWLPYGRDTHLDKDLLASLKHGSPVTVRLQQVRRPPVTLWEVVALSIGHGKPGGLGQGAAALASRGYRPVVGKYFPNPTGGTNGYVCWNNDNIATKHDERVFFSMGTPKRLSVPPHIIDDWRNLLLDYKAVYRRDGWTHKETTPSRHLKEEDSERLKEGDLCYVKLKRDDSREDRPLEKNAGQPVVEALYPVMIGRELGNWSPFDLLPEKLRPATSIDELSPADRVFGWVRDETANRPGETDAPSKKEGPSAWKGQLRIAPIRCEVQKDANGRTSSPIEPVPGGGELPLAILSAPKPSQARFYASPDKAGAPFPNGSDIRAKGYFEKHASATDPQSGLRGRKFYPHHRAACEDSVFKDYWNLAAACNDAKQEDAQPVGPNGKLYREYVRRTDKRNQPKQDSQNRSIRDWIRPGTYFTTHIDVMNLNTAELGVLLWLLDLGNNEPPGHLRLGGGKPLGFGSVRVRITRLDLAKAKAKREEYRSFFGPSPQERDKQEADGHRLTGTGDEVKEKLAAQGSPVAIFKNAIEDAYGGRKRGSFEQVAAIAAFLNAARGFKTFPVHYPRGGVAPDAPGENYLWFVANQSKDGPKLSLPDISIADPGLPLLSPQPRNR